MKETSRQLFERLLKGQSVARIPWALWRHYPNEEFLPEPFIEATVQFYKDYPFDLIKIGPRSSYQIRDYGTRDHFKGDALGRPDYAEPTVTSAAEWWHLTALPVTKGYMGQTLDCARRIVDSLKGERPILMTVFSPFSQARNLRGTDEIAHDLIHETAALKYALEVLAENTRGLIEQIRGLEIDGLFYAVQDAGSAALVHSPLRDWVMHLDAELLSGCPLWLNMVHLHGSISNLTPYLSYPVSILHYDEQVSGIALETVANRFAGIVGGGLNWGAENLRQCTPLHLEGEARRLSARMKGARFMLSASCVIPFQFDSDQILACKPPDISLQNVPK